MKTIYKYPLRIAGIQTIRMPSKAKVLSAKMQHGQLTVWAEVDTDEDDRDTNFLVIGTGSELPSGLDEYGYRFVDTVMDGPFVWHVYVKEQ